MRRHHREKAGLPFSLGTNTSGDTPVKSEPGYAEPESAVAEFGENVPLKRPGQPAEVAPAYVLLASGEASDITGAVLPVTGGRPML